MASSSSHQQGNGHFISNSPYFFKIILQDTIQNGKLGIPRKFVKNHGNCMSSPAVLRVPSGAVWKVELTKCDGEIWLRKGWLEFSNHYSLGSGHILVFRYDGNSNFHVLIFDRSASEIQYPCAGIDHWKMREKSQSSCPTRKGDKRSSYNRIHPFEKGKALESACNAIKSENPFFLVVMQPSYVGHGCGEKYSLNIPAKFAEKHLMKGHCSVILCSSSGKTWIAAFKQRYIRKRLYSYLQTGWATFVRDNNIQVGDVCTFELINSIEISLKVLIYKAQHASNHQSLTSTDVFRRVKQKPPSNASAFKSENPFFVIALQQSYVHGPKLSIPADFARKHLTNMHNDVILLLSNGKSWPVKYYQEGPKPNVIFRKGWRKFVEDNDLEVGDACAFELIKGAETSMNVTIYKKQAVEDTNLGSSLEFISEEASFVVVLKNCKKYRLHVPRGFAEEMGLADKPGTVIKDSKGRKWPLNIYVDAKSSVHLGAGWSKFVEENKLEVGDSLLFHHIPNTGNVINFKIITKAGEGTLGK